MLECKIGSQQKGKWMWPPGKKIQGTEETRHELSQEIRKGLERSVT